MKLEPFANYQDVKTKTVNWCNKMQKSGLLSSDQFNDCVSTFTDATTEFLPDDFKIPNTGISRNFYFIWAVILIILYILLKI